MGSNDDHHDCGACGARGMDFTDPEDWAWACRYLNDAGLAMVGQRFAGKCEACGKGYTLAEPLIRWPWERRYCSIGCLAASDEHDFYARMEKGFLEGVSPTVRMLYQRLLGYVFATWIGEKAGKP